jgi:hypothetical protein
VTIDDVRYVLDCGRAKEMSYDASRGQGLPLVHFSARRNQFMWDLLVISVTKAAREL